VGLGRLIFSDNVGTKRRCFGQDDLRYRAVTANKLEVYLPFPIIRIIGLVCLLIGIAFLLSLAMGVNIVSFNPFLYLGLLCYGIDLLDISA
jgi:hypothetical protein